MSLLAVLLNLKTNSIRVFLSISMSVKVELVNILTTYNIQPIRRLHNPKRANLRAERWQVIQAASKDLVH